MVCSGCPQEQFELGTDGLVKMTGVVLKFAS